MKDNYLEFISNLELKEIQLVSMTTKKISDYPPENSATLKETVKEKSIITSGTGFNIDVIYSLEGFYLDKEKRKHSILRIKLDYRLMYDTGNAGLLTLSNIKKVKVKTARLNVWPYIRHKVYNITGEMGLPPVTLRLLSSIR